MADLDVAVRLKFLTQGEEKLRGAARDLANFGKATGKLSGPAMGRFGGSLTRAWTASAKLGGALDKSASAAGRTAGALDRIGREARDIDRARAAVDRLTKSTRGLGAAGAKMRAAGAIGGMGGLGGGTALAAGAMAGAAARRRRTAAREALAEAASRVTPEGYLIGAGGAVMAGAAIGGTAAAGLGAAALATREAIGRDKAFADIRKKVNLDEGQSWDDIDRKVRRVATTLGIAYERSAAIFAQGGQGNIATRDLEDFGMLAAKMSAAWDIGGREAAQTLTEIKGQTGWNIAQMETFADKVNYLGDISAAAEKDVASMWQRASAGAKAAGVSYDDSLVAMTALRSVGMQDEVAARFFGAFSSKLRRATTLSKDAQAAFKELGLSAKGVEKGMSADAMGTMIDLLERLGKAKNPVGIATALGGGEWFDEILRMRESLAELLRLRAEMAKGGFEGSLKKAQDIDLGTAEAKLSKLKESLLDLAATAVKPVALPWLSDVADKWSAAADRFRSAQQRSEDSRRAAQPVGESTAAYERRLRLDRPVAAPRPMMAQIEGATPHIDVEQIDVAAADGIAKANSLFDALQKLNTTVTPQVNSAAAIGQLDALTARAQQAAGALRALGSFGAPGAGIRVGPSISGGRGGSSGSGGGAAPAATTPGKQARRSGGAGGVQIAQAHFHGVRDVHALRRQLASLEARAVRNSRDAALHDIA